MGVRSDVGIAMKECVVNHLSPEARKFLEEYHFEERCTIVTDDLANHGRLTKDDLGTLFVTTDVKWYLHSYDDIRAFYAHLNECHDEEDYLIVAACSEYPEDDEGNDGEWHDNPFNLHRRVSVELSWD